MTEQRKVHLALITVSLLFGISYVLTKIILHDVPPRVWAFYRVIIATATLMPFILNSGVLRAVKSPRLWLAGLFGIALNQLLFAEGLRLTTPSHSALINACIPAITLIFSLIAGRELWNPRNGIGIVCAIIGVAVLIGKPQGGQLIGDLLTVANVLSFSLFLVISQPLAKSFPALGLTGFYFFEGVLLLGLNLVLQGNLAEDWQAVTHAPLSAQATAFSSSIVKKFSYHVTDAVLSKNRGQLAATPLFLGEDFDIHGKPAGNSAKLSALHWPNPWPHRLAYEHTELKRGVLQVAGQTINNKIKMQPDFIPNLLTLLQAFGGPMWESMYSTFPGRHSAEMIIPGDELRGVLSKIIPDLDKYMQVLIDHLDTMAISRGEGKLVADIWLTTDRLDFPLRDESEATTGQPYMVSLARHTHFELSMKKRQHLCATDQGFYNNDQASDRA